MSGEDQAGLSREQLVHIANMPMPFGKYQGRALVDLPEEYLLWFSRKGFPQGQLGQLMAMTLSLKVEGLEGLLKPLRGMSPDQASALKGKDVRR